MAIAKKPASDSNQMLSNANQLTSEQKSFISGAKENDEQSRQKSKPVMLRVEPKTLEMIDRAAKRAGLKRAAFILSSAVQRAGRMERE